MTTEQILQECKQEYAEKKGYFTWSEMEEDYLRDGATLFMVKEALKISDIYAKRISVLFCEYLNKEKINIYSHSRGEYCTSELYTEFLNQLNSTK